jgi:hypothetical protein
VTLDQNLCVRKEFADVSFAMGLFGVHYSDSEKFMVFGKNKGVIFESIHIKRSVFFAGRLLRLIFICTIVPGIIIWVIGLYLSNPYPDAVGNSLIRAILATDRLINSKQRCYKEEVESILKQCGISYQLCFSATENEGGSYPPENKMINDLSRREKKALSRGTKILVNEYGENGNCRVLVFQGETLEIATDLNLRCLNEFQNIKEFEFKECELLSAETMDLSHLVHIKKLICNHSYLHSDCINPCPNLEEVVLKESVIYAKNGIDCSDCHGLKKIVLDECCREENGHVITTYGITLPQDQKIVVVITGIWQSGECLDALRKKYYGAQNVDIVYDYACCFKIGDLLPARCSMLIPFCQSPLREAKSISIQCRNSESLWEITDSGDDISVLGTCDELSRLRPVSCIKNLDEINQYPNIEKIIVKANWFQAMHSFNLNTTLNLGDLKHVREFECVHLIIDSGGIIFGPGAEKITIRQSAIAGGGDCTKCTEIKELNLTACSFGSMLNFNGGIFHFWHLAEDGLGPYAQVTLGLDDVQLPKIEADQLRVTIDGLWYADILDRLLENLKQEGVKNIANSAKTITCKNNEPILVNFLPDEITDCCKLIGIDPNQFGSLTFDEVKKAYKAKAFVEHPDRNGHTREATLRFQNIKNAYDKICYVRRWIVKKT